MPIVNINRYTCPITGAVEYGFDLPPGWFVIMGEVFGPQAATPLAQYIIDHPGAGFTELINNLTQKPQ